ASSFITDRSTEVTQPSEHHEPQLIAYQILHHPAGFAHATTQTVRAHTLSEHRARDVDRQREREAACLRDDVLLAPAGPGERDDAQEGGDGERGGSEPSGRERRPHRLLGPQGGATHPGPARPG